MEWVLLVPPKVTQSAHALLLKANCLARPWHLEGRFGSRTHAVVLEGHVKRIGIPVLSKACVLKKADEDAPDLKDLLSQEGVEFVWKEFVHAKRAVRTMPYVDATVHPERKPANVSLDTTREQHNVEWNKHKDPPAFTYVDLFAGIGGFAVALDALGGQCVLASELEECCQATYRRNFPTAPLRGDIYRIPSDPPPTTTAKSLDILVGGFPCQPFSALGEQPGLTCPKGNLFQEIVRLLKAWQPKAFLLENVPGLLAMEDNTFSVILEALRGAGYDVTYEVCNARGLTATSRKRLFLVGLSEQSTTNTTRRAFEFPFFPDLQLKASDVLDYKGIELSDMERRVLPVTDEQLQILNHSKRWKPADLAWPNTVCDTLVSHYGNSITRGASQLVPCSGGSGSGEGMGNTNPRRFSPRECLRIMGFPTSYQLLTREEGSKQGDMAYCKEQYRMIGNAVCPPLIAALAGAVLDRVLTTKPPSGIQASNSSDWVAWGRHVAQGLAYEAVRPERPGATAHDLEDTNGTVENEASAIIKKGTKRGYVTVS